MEVYQVTIAFSSKLGNQYRQPQPYPVCATTIDHKNASGLFSSGLRRLHFVSINWTYFSFTTISLDDWTPPLTEGRINVGFRFLMNLHHICSKISSGRKASLRRQVERFQCARSKVWRVRQQPEPEQGRNQEFTRVGFWRDRRGYPRQHILFADQDIPSSDCGKSAL